MARASLELLQRVKTILPEKSDWFRVLADWYANGKEAQKLAEQLDKLAARDCWLALTVNGQTFVKRFHVDDPDVHELAWIIPADLLRPKNNEITVAVENESHAELLLASAAIAQKPDGVRQTLDLSVRNPRTLPTLWIPAFSGARHRPQYLAWAIVKGGSMTFALAAPALVPVHFILNAATATDGLLALDDLLDDILEAVQRKQDELAKRLEKLDKRSPEAAPLEDDLDDLQAYKKLHKQEIETACGRATRIDKVHELGGTKAPHKDKAVRTTVKPVAVRPGPGIFAGLFKALIILLVVGIGGGLCYSAWKNGELNIPFLDEIVARNHQNAKLERDIADRLQASGAKTGELQISLAWFNKNDLDLHVVCPSGDTIFYGHRQTLCGGKLDVDMNIVYAMALDKPVENIYWTKAPRGHYKIYVNHYTNHGQPDCQDPTAFAVRLVKRGRTQVFTGEVVCNDPAKRRVLVHEFDVN